MSEAEWQQQVIDLATMYGWLVYHTHDSRRSMAGFPDLSMVNITFMMAELKTERGRVSEAQQLWISKLQSAGVEINLWRPSDVDDVIDRLSRR